LDREGRAIGAVGGGRAWNEWMNEYIVVEKKLKKLRKSYDPVFRGLHGNVARKG